MLETYQTDNPMIPYLYFVLKAIIKQLFELMLQAMWLMLVGLVELKEINLEDKKNLFPLEKMNVGFVTLLYNIPTIH